MTLGLQISIAFPPPPGGEEEEEEVEM